MHGASQPDHEKSRVRDGTHKHWLTLKSEKKYNSLQFVDKHFITVAKTHL